MKAICHGASMAEADDTSVTGTMEQLKHTTFHYCSELRWMNEWIELWKLFDWNYFIDDSIIVCFRWKSGVASSLNYIKISDEKSPVLYPYPSWEANELPTEAGTTESNNNYGGGRTDAKAAEKAENVLEKNNATIISTFRIRIDECDRLWVMDSGLADILGSPKQWAPNSIAVFDLNTDKLIRRFVIPEDQVKEDSFFANIVSIIWAIIWQNYDLKYFSRS